MTAELTKAAPELNTPTLRELVTRLALEIDPEATLEAFPEALAFQIDMARAVIRSALQDKAGEVRQFRRVGCADWYDGNQDHEDGRGPYEARTLYAAQPAPVVPDGFALVPVVATFDMRAAGNIELDRLKNTPGMLVADRAFYVWAAMLAASQQKGGSAG